MLHREPLALVLGRVLRGEPRGDAGQLGLGLTNADVRRETADAHDPQGPATLEDVRRQSQERRRRERHPDVRRQHEGALEPLGRHAQDGERCSVEYDGLPDDRWVRLEAPAPEPVDQHDDGIRPGCAILIHCEEAA